MSAAIEDAKNVLYKEHRETPKPDGLIFGMAALNMSLRAATSGTTLDADILKAANAILSLTDKDPRRDAGLHAFGLLLRAYAVA